MPDHTGQSHAPAYQLFNLNRDPGERKNIIDTHQVLSLFGLMILRITPILKSCQLYGYQKGKTCG